MKYFINYDKYKNKSDKNLLDRVYIKKQINNDYKFYSAFIFSSNLSLLEETDKKQHIVYVELNEDEMNEYSISDIEKYEENGYSYKRVYDKFQNEDVTLINYNCIKNMSLKELESGKIVKVESNDGYYKISENNDMDRNILQQTDIGCDLYFYTENEELLNKYQDQTVIFENVRFNKYKLSKHVLFIIDSLSHNQVYDFLTDTYIKFRTLCDSAIKVSLYENDDYYSIKILDSLECEGKKGYIISKSNLSSMIFDKNIEPLLKYINVYTLTEKGYKKENIKEYLKDHIALKKSKVNKYKINNETV